MVRIVRFHKTGGPEVLQIDELDSATPGHGELRIKVKALGLNRAEVMFRSGNYLEVSQLPSRLGYEAAGTVDAVGDGVEGFSSGDIVSVVPPPSQSRYGVYGEEAIVPAAYAVKHPSSLSFIEAAAVWMQYLTAYGALVDIAQMKAGEFVIIAAASSSVGIAAIQLCNMLGAVPIATTRKSDKKAALINAGAAAAIATEEEDLVAKLHDATKGGGARLVFDPVGGPTVEKLAQGMSPHGILFQYGALSPDPTPFPLFLALSKGLTMRGYTLFEILADAERFAKAKRFIVDGIEAGSLKPVIAKTFPLENIVDAHRYLESNRQFGKIIVTV